MTPMTNVGQPFRGPSWAKKTRPVGIVSIGDVVNAHVEETEFENRMLRDYIHGVTY